jgi:hypothetical protein
VERKDIGPPNIPTIITLFHMMGVKIPVSACIMKDPKLHRAIKNMYWRKDVSTFSLRLYSPKKIKGIYMRKDKAGIRDEASNIILYP